MSHGKKRRRPTSGEGPAAPELNIMPFIDIFSMLNTFLLVSASFLGLGVLEVQIPFLSNSPDTKEEPQRSFSIRVDLEETGIKLTTLWTAPPVEKTEAVFQLNDADIERFHQEMIAFRNKVPENDKVTLYSDDAIAYEQFIKVLDAIKTLKENEPPLKVPPSSPQDPNKPRRPGGFVFEKVVVGSVIL